MCIRDRFTLGILTVDHTIGFARAADVDANARYACLGKHRICLLYTSDAADERSSVDLGGRRIIKKKSNTEAAAARVKNYRTTHNEPKDI